MVEGWSFLVARGRRTRFRTLLAPQFLVDENLHHLLAESTGAGGVGADGARIVEVDNAAVGPLSVGYTSDRLVRADVEATSPNGDELLADEHGRPLEIVYGVVSRDELQGPLDAEDLQTARTQALHSYRSFLTDESGHSVDTSVPFALRTPGRVRGVRGPDPAATRQPAAVSRRTAALPRPPWRPARRLVGAIAVILFFALTAVAAVLVFNQPSREVTVYSSLPLQGPQRLRSQDMIRGMDLALKQAHGKAGKFRVRYQSLDDSTRGIGGWSRQAVSVNARRAAQSHNTAVFIGDFDSGASAVSIPILSRAKVAQISPSNTAIGLTIDEPGAGKDEPVKYYARGFRNYARIVPRDTVQTRALATATRDDGCSRVAIVHARNDYGDALASMIRRSMKAQGRRPVLDEALGSGSTGSRRTWVGRVASRHADCVILSGVAGSAAVAVFEQGRRLGSKVRLYGSDGVAQDAFSAVTRGRLPAGIVARLRLMLPPGAAYAAGRGFLAAFRREYPGRPDPDPYAVYAYEAMRLALDAIERSGTAERVDIVDALFDTRDRHSVIGTYSIDRNGDTTLTHFGLFAIRHGALVLERRIQPSS